MKWHKRFIKEKIEVQGKKRSHSKAMTSIFNVEIRFFTRKINVILC